MEKNNENIIEINKEPKVDISEFIGEEVEHELSGLIIISEGELYDAAFTAYKKAREKSDISGVDNSTLGQHLLGILNLIITLNNSHLERGDKFRSRKKLPVPLVSRLVHDTYTIKNVSLLSSKFSTKATKSGCVLSYYCDERFKNPKDYGLYIQGEDKIRSIIYSFDSSYDSKDVDTILSTIRDTAPIVLQDQNPNLLPLKDYILNTETLKKIKYNENLIFTTKIPVNYNPNAEDVEFELLNGDVLTVDKFFKQYANGDKETEEALWKVASAVIGFNKDIEKCVVFYSQSGNNGKGTFCELLRSLVGHENTCSIPIDQWSGRFTKSVLIGAKAVIVDENNVGKYIEETADFKAAVTHDMLTIDIKNKDPIQYAFDGVMVQCVNKILKFKDDTESHYRRFALIEFKANYRGIQDKSVKEVFVKDERVLEYVLKRIVELGKFDDIQTPSKSMYVMEDTKNTNNPVRDFWKELKDQLAWDILPYDFAFQLFEGWNDKDGGGRKYRKRNFLNDLKAVIDEENISGDDTSWTYTIEDEKIRTSDRLEKPEPLILKYNLNDWKNQNYKGYDEDRIATPSKVSSQYRCFYRKRIKEED